ncbi:Rieske (2Fe-2S) protein [Streptomyces griseoviridis]|uniref:Cytochrome bc1 complex Rieske iron-sulfur subunit n=1 Tax=Streptomyces griseoviridis TaxID=45398 RepID=A0A3S9ZJV4_STRGD|nr:Rieske (2Fe-2S) protein [Streptomyces griseoviridis]AZS88135.1 Rieske (2Fe-2S) protein [Streptomyces griseoviridis]QCN85020.1 iron-sulfur protein [Streptomyces griseoviridis]
MTHASTRRTILLTTGAVALAAGCGSESGGGSGAASQSAGSGGKELATTADIPVGGGTIFNNQKVVVTQPKKDEFKCFSAICTHQGCTVAKVANGTIDCPCHGSKFHIADGSVAHGPATRPLPAEKFEVRGNSIRLT